MRPIFRATSTRPWISRIASCWKKFSPKTAGHRVEILNPQRGQKHAFLELVEKNAKHSFVQRFRVLKPSSEAIAEALESALGLARAAQADRMLRHFAYPGIGHGRFDGRVGRRADEEIRLPEIHHSRRGHGCEGPDKAEAACCATILPACAKPSSAVTAALHEEHKPLPSLILIDGGIGQLHAAAQALEKLEIINQPLASIAKKEEILYVLGREDEPIVLDRHSPVLHLIQQIRDETHRFAVTFHRQRRSSRRLRTSLTEIPGVGEHTAQKLLRRFGSVARLQPATLEELTAEIPRSQAQRVYDGLHAVAAQTPTKI